MTQNKIPTLHKWIGVLAILIIVSTLISKSFYSDIIIILASLLIMAFNASGRK